MALPTLEKTWELNLNNRYSSGNADTDHRWALLTIHDTLTGFSNNPWTLSGSSDGVTFGYPGPGWQTTGDIITSYGGNRSWAIFERPNSGGEILFYVWNNYNSSGYYYLAIGIYWSAAAGFSGGGLTSRPTATDEIRMIGESYNDEWYTGEGSTGRPMSMHFLHSTDGKHTYIVLCAGGKCNNIMFFTTPEDYPPGWNTPHLCAMDSETGVNIENATYGNYYSNQRFRGRNNSNGAISASMIMPGYDGSLVPSTMNLPCELDTSPGWPMVPISIGASAGEHAGVLGRLPDVWGGSTTRGTGDHYPDDGTYQFAQFGDYIFPWDGTMPTAW